MWSAGFMKVRDYYSFLSSFREIRGDLTLKNLMTRLALENECF